MHRNFANGPNMVSDLCLYMVVQKRITVLFGDSFGNSAPILTILSLLQA